MNITHSKYALILLMSIAFLLRGIHLDRNELWFDEAYAVLISSHLDTLIGEVERDSGPPGYYLILHLWMRLWGDTEKSVRFLSVVAGVITVPLVFVWGLALGSRLMGLLAAALLTFSPLHIYYSRETRVYALLLFVMTFVFFSLTRLVQGHRGKATWIALLLGTLATLYLHYFGIFLLPILFLVFSLFLAPKDRRWGWLVLMGICVGYLPWIPILLGQIKNDASAWLIRLWQNTPPHLALIKTFFAFSPGGEVPGYLRLLGEFSRIGAGVATGILFFIGCFSAYHDRIYRILLVGFLGLLIPPYLISFVKPIYLVARYDLVALSCFFLILSTGWITLSDLLDHRFTTYSWIGRMFPYVLAGCLWLLAMQNILSYHTLSPLETARRQADFLKANASPNAIVLCTGYTRNPLEYYLRDTRIRFLSFPSSFALHRGWMDLEEITNRDRLRLDAKLLFNELSQNQVFLIHAKGFSHANLPLYEMLTSACQEDAPQSSDLGITVWRCHSTETHPKLE